MSKEGIIKGLDGISEHNRKTDGRDDFLEGFEKGYNKAKKEILDKTLEDYYELLNNLEDDLELDLRKGEDGYRSYGDSYIAIKTYTLKLLKKKIKELKKQIKGK